MRSATILVGTMTLFAAAPEEMANAKGNVLGVNGFGRIGKLTVRHHVERAIHEPETAVRHVVVNTGRHVGESMHSVAHYLERDSTYGLLQEQIGGGRAEPMIHSLDEAAGSMQVGPVKVTVLRQHRKPHEIQWETHDVRTVVDTTGKHNHVAEGEALRGHFERPGVEKILISAPPSLRDGQSMPHDVVTTVMGINGNDYDPRTHRIISNASCTTTALAHMMLPMVNYYGVNRIFSAAMATVHAVTGSQEVLDSPTSAGKEDLRKNRSILNNIILTSTGAAKTLALVMNNIKDFHKLGFLAESVRVPTNTGSLIILNLTLKDPAATIRKEEINGVYKEAAKTNHRLIYDPQQNVSGDIIGNRFAVVIEGHETHTRTSARAWQISEFNGLSQQKAKAIAKILGDEQLVTPITNTTIYGWYDNEWGYVNLLGDRTVSVMGLPN